ncbi:MAG: hypothetical protein CL678_18845 [Bdellovibrionaceae bacterium]|nr:hypothetical protein [Pseudobdellovibrionaceae bacterium]|tara:strand:- start:10039 stop:10536 length:498 start_codon:yes stop_codon:yes gene_type:complete
MFQIRSISAWMMALAMGISQVASAQASTEEALKLWLKASASYAQGVEATEVINEMVQSAREKGLSTEVILREAAVEGLISEKQYQDMTALLKKIASGEVKVSKEMIERARNGKIELGDVEALASALKGPQGSSYVYYYVGIGGGLVIFTGVLFIALLFGGIVIIA